LEVFWSWAFFKLMITPLLSICCMSLSWNKILKWLKWLLWNQLCAYDNSQYTGYYPWFKTSFKQYDDWFEFLFLLSHWLFGILFWILFKLIKLSFILRLNSFQPKK
jgi:hypothetical protein